MVAHRLNRQSPSAFAMQMFEACFRQRRENCIWTSFILTLMSTIFEEESFLETDHAKSTTKIYWLYLFPYSLLCFYSPYLLVHKYLGHIRSTKSNLDLSLSNPLIHNWKSHTDYLVFKSSSVLCQYWTVFLQKFQSIIQKKKLDNKKLDNS